MSYLNIHGRQVRVTNIDKVMWPKTGTTKAQMLEYYIKASPRLLPCLQGRLVSVQRFPHGAGAPGFYQKNCPDNAPDWVNTYTLHRTGGKYTDYVLVDSLPTLIWLANLGVIEFHPWLSSLPNLDNPDYAVFDLDPMEKYGIEEVRQVALGIKELLDRLELVGQAKTSGATGLQIFVHLEPVYTYKQVRDFVLACCTVINKNFPQWTTLARSINQREGKIYLDYGQNAREQTIVSTYSLRPRPLPTYSAPLQWEDLLAPLEPERYNLHSFMENAHLPEWLNTPRQRLEFAVGFLKTLV